MSMMLLAEQFDTAGAGPPLAGEHPQQAGLAGAGRSDQGYPFASGQAQADVGKGALAVGVDQVHAVEAQAHFSRPAARADSSMPL